MRTAYGPFDIKSSVTPEQLETAVRNGSWTALLQPMDTVLSLWEKVILSDEQIEIVRHGAGLALEAGEAIVHLRAYDKASSLVALLGFDSENRLWRPQKVFH